MRIRQQNKAASVAFCVRMINPTIQLFRIFLMFLPAMCSGFAFAAEPGKQSTAAIELSVKPKVITPKEFYLARIDDERADYITIGVVQTMSAKQSEAIKAVIKGGPGAIRNYISESYTVDKSLRPLVIKINNINITETAEAYGRVKGKVVVSVQFGLQKGEDFVALGNYSGGSTYTRSAGVAQLAEPFLRNALNNTLIYINNWMNTQAPVNSQLAKAVVISFTDQTQQLDEDTIYYNPVRPLTWADFKEKPPRNSRYGAAVFTGFGYDDDTKLKNSVIYVNLNVKVFAPKSACWVRYEGMTPYGLNHEQRHFDVAKIVAENFKKKIRDAKLTLDNYEAFINMEYLESLRELNRMQKQYDGDTEHSVNSWAQQQWNIKIDKQLQESAPKPLI